MSQVIYEQSVNYVWDLAKLLGKGSYGHVYEGQDKRTGQKVAVKVINEQELKSPFKTQIQELNVLQSVTHPNIISLLAVENEMKKPTRIHPAGNGKRVFVLELCEGGSLDKVLKNPENNFGLPQNEFLLLLKHFTSGIKCLREKNIMHRDLKPGNILKYIENNGLSVYKIADFDFARELAETERFSTINVGTWDYLHPQLYKTNLLRDLDHKDGFPASTDLWSIGVTLFQAISSELPFVSFHHDKNKMLEILLTKAEGVISGTQRESKGEIVWSRILPIWIHLTEHLRDLVTPLLAELLQPDLEKGLDYNTFISKAENIYQRKHIHIFFANFVRTVDIFFDPNDSIEVMNDLIEKYTKVPKQNQLLLFKNQVLDLKSIQILPMTSPENPIILFDKNNLEIQKVPDEREQMHTNRLTFYLFKNRLNLEDDKTTAKNNCAVGHEFLRKTQQTLLNVKLLNLTAETINQLVIKELTNIQKENMEIRESIHSMYNQLTMLCDVVKSCHSFYAVVNISSKETNPAKLGADLITVKGLLDKMKSNFNCTNNEFEVIVAELVTLKTSIKHLIDGRTNNALLIEWHEVSSQQKNQEHFELAYFSVKNYLEELKEIYDYIYNERWRLLNASLGEFNYLLKRQTMQTKCTDIYKVITEESDNFFELFVNSFAGWYLNAQTALIQPDVLKTNIMNLKSKLATCQSSIDNMVKNHKIYVGAFTKALEGIQESKLVENKNGSGSIKSEKISKIKNEVEELAREQQTFKNELKETIELCLQFQNTALDLSKE